MQIPQNEMQLIYVAGGVVVFTILAIIVFALNISNILFYIFAIIAIALGFYLSYTLSKEAPAKTQAMKKK